jgi:hypothetical protein
LEIGRRHREEDEGTWRLRKISGTRGRRVGVEYGAIARRERKCVRERGSRKRYTFQQ